MTLNREWPASGLERVLACPACGDARREQEFDGLRDWAFAAAPGAWSLQRCQGCRAMYLDPRPDRESIGLAYSNYFTHADPSADSRPGTSLRQLKRWLVHAMENRVRNRLFATKLRPAIAAPGFVAWLLRISFDPIRTEARGLEKLPVGSVLDVGCGSGQFLALARQMGWQCYGVEIDPVAAQVARDTGAAIVSSRVETLDASYDGRFDVVTLSHVIEHGHDPQETLRHCRRVLKPGGHLWIETPNIDSAGYRLFGRFWRGLESPRHLVIFNAESLRMILRDMGFERIEVLEPKDVMKHMFTRSALMEAGRIADVDLRPLSSEERETVRRKMEEGRTIVRENVWASEFINITARRPLIVAFPR